MSPLHRIMWVYNPDEPDRRLFENNVCAFHIGNGYFLSVAHNLRVQAGFFHSMNRERYEAEIWRKLDGSQARLMEQYYLTDEYTGKKYLSTNDHGSLEHIRAILRQKMFDTRWVSMAEKGICHPHVILQFREDLFYKDAEVTQSFNPGSRFYDASARRYTYMLPVELVEAFYAEDIALYRIIDTPPEVIAKIPSLPVSYDFFEDDSEKLYCLQSSPGGAAGRLLNVAHIEGVLDHFGMFPDEVGGNYLFEGFRYLIKGYFRFGSSGAPYICYDSNTGQYSLNAVQSEASGLQLSIKNDREGNFQYVNAIASPLYIIKDRLQAHIGNGQE